MKLVVNLKEELTSQEQELIMRIYATLGVRGITIEFPSLSVAQMIDIKKITHYPIEGFDTSKLETIFNKLPGYQILYSLLELEENESE